MSVKQGIYKHYKGKMYRVHGTGRHSETLDDYVIYEPLYKSESRFWIRPLTMFLEEVLIDGKKIPRFKFIKEA